MKLFGDLCLQPQLAIRKKAKNCFFNIEKPAETLSPSTS